MQDETNKINSHEPLDDFEQIEIMRNFIHTFNFNLQLLLNRSKQLRKISPYDPNRSVEWFTFFDCIIVQFRAMFMENERYDKNYTYQNYLLSYNKVDVVNKINEYLNTPLIDETILDFDSNILTIKNAIKFLADKFICHYDKITTEERMRMELITNTLSNLRNKSVNNIEIILFKIFKFFKE